MPNSHTPDHKKEIIKHLERCTASGHRQDKIFEDWLDLVEATLDMLPSHLASAAKGVPLTDTPEVEKIFNQVKDRYKGEHYMDNFQQAFAALLSSAADGWSDVLGSVYMEFAYPNPGAGQYFTPWNIAECMAEMTLHDIESEIHERLKKALMSNVEGELLLLAAACIQDPCEQRRFFANRLIPAAAPYYDPLLISDPCCGSGVMLLAAASKCPRWAIDFGLVRFYGQDIDMTCVKMARVNYMLYGLNNYGLKCALSLSVEELEAIPEPYSSAYATAQMAQQSGDLETVARISFNLRRNQFNFFNLAQDDSVCSVP